jgi:hypothetical protein
LVVGGGGWGWATVRRGCARGVGFPRVLAPTVQRFVRAVDHDRSSGAVVAPGVCEGEDGARLGVVIVRGWG